MTDVEIPDAAIEAAEKAYWVAYSDAVRNAPSNRNGQGITERDARTAGIAGRRASIVAALEHLTPAPQAEGDVREREEVIADVANDILDALNFEPGTRDAEHDAVADVVRRFLASGLVVPVGEVEHEDYNAPHRDQRVTALREEYTKVVQRQIKAKKRAQDERDDALAVVEKVRALHAGWMADGPKDDPALLIFLERLDDILAGVPAPASLPARLLSGEHVGREVVLPDGTGGQITATPCVRLDIWNSTTGEGNPLKIRHIAPDDVVTLVEDS